MVVNWQKYAAAIAVVLGLGTISSWLLPSTPWMTKSEAAAVKQDLSEKLDKITNAVGALQSNQQSDHVNALVTQLSILRLQLMFETKARDEVAIAETKAEIDRITRQLSRAEGR